MDDMEIVDQINDLKRDLLDSDALDDREVVLSDSFLKKNCILLYNFLQIKTESLLC